VTVPSPVPQEGKKKGKKRKGSSFSHCQTQKRGFESEFAWTFPLLAEPGHGEVGKKRGGKKGRSKQGWVPKKSRVSSSLSDLKLLLTAAQKTRKKEGGEKERPAP